MTILSAQILSNALEQTKSENDPDQRRLAMRIWLDAHGFTKESINESDPAIRSAVAFALGQQSPKAGKKVKRQEQAPPNPTDKVGGFELLQRRTNKKKNRHSDKKRTFVAKPVKQSKSNRWLYSSLLLVPIIFGAFYVSAEMERETKRVEIERQQAENLRIEKAQIARREEGLRKISTASNTLEKRRHKFLTQMDSWCSTTWSQKVRPRSPSLATLEKIAKETEWYDSCMRKRTLSKATSFLKQFNLAQGEIADIAKSYDISYPSSIREKATKNDVLASVQDMYILPRHAWTERLVKKHLPNALAKARKNAAQRKRFAQQAAKIQRQYNNAMSQNLQRGVTSPSQWNSFGLGFDNRNGISPEGYIVRNGIVAMPKNSVTSESTSNGKAESVGNATHSKNNGSSGSESVSNQLQNGSSSGSKSISDQVQNAGSSGSKSISDQLQNAGSSGSKSISDKLQNAGSSGSKSFNKQKNETEKLDKSDHYAGQTHASEAKMHSSTLKFAQSLTKTAASNKAYEKCRNIGMKLDAKTRQYTTPLCDPGTEYTMKGFWCKVRVTYICKPRIPD